MAFNWNKMQSTPAGSLERKQAAMPVLELGNIITFIATGKWVQDSQCGFKVLGPKAVAQIDLKMRGFEFCTEIVRECANHKWRMAEIPAKVMYSEYTLAKGQSFAGGVKTALKILLRSFLR
jgi:hypothetical protein